MFSIIRLIYNSGEDFVHIKELSQPKYKTSSSN